VDAVACRPLVALAVVLDLIGMIVDLAVDLDRQPCVAATEVERVVPGFVLPPKLETVRALAKNSPEQDFR
jgi:hypothetical protein